MIEEEELEKTRSSEQVFADTAAEIQFLEENMQLPGAVEEAPVAPPPAPAPSPVADPTAPPAPSPVVAPQTPAQEMGPTQPQPSLLDELLFREQNEMLPGAVTASDPLVTYTRQSDVAKGLLDEIGEHEQAIAELDASLGTIIPGEELFTMDLDDLDTYYQTAGVEPTGPFAGLNRKIVTANAELQSVVQKLDSMNPELVTTQAEVDEWNRLIGRYNELSDELQGLEREYNRHAEDLQRRWRKHERALMGSDDEAGLLKKYTSLFGSGGLADTMMGMGAVDPTLQNIRASQVFSPEELEETGIHPDTIVSAGAERPGTPDIPDELRDALRMGALKTTSLKKANQGIAFELTQAAKAYQDMERRQRQNLMLGATTEAMQQFRTDPGFQEFTNQLVSMNAEEALGPEGASLLADALGLGSAFDNSALTIAARKNPYGGDPVPLNTDILMMMRSQPEENFGRSLSGMFGIPFQFAGAMLESAGAGRLADIPGMGQFGAELLGGIGTALEQTFDFTTRATHASTGALVRDPLQAVLPRWAYDGQEDANEFRRYIMTREEDAYEGLPWYSSAGLFVGGELILDPFNIIIPGAGKGAKAAIRAGKAKRGATFTDAIDNALRHGTQADTDFLLSVKQISNTHRSVPDNWRLITTQRRFSEAARRSNLRVTPDAADIFGQRMAARLWTRDPSEWSDILNQEIGRLAENFNRSLDEAAVANINNELRVTDAFRNVNGTEFWRELGVEHPTVFKDTPAWRQGRQQVLSDPNAWWDITRETPITQLVAIEFGPDIAIGQRWGEFINWYGTSSKIPGASLTYSGENLISYLLPGESRAVQVVKATAAERFTGPRDVSDSMMENLNQIARMEGKQIARTPRTMGEYWDEVYRLTNEFGGKKFPGSATPDTVITHPAYRNLSEQAVGRLRRGQHVPGAELPVQPYQMANLTKRSIMYGKNLFDELLNPRAPAEAGLPASAQRYAWINDRLPATPAQTAEIVQLSSKLGKRVSDRSLGTLRWDDARDLIAQLRFEKDMASYERHEKGGRGRKKQPKAPDLKRVASYYDEDIFNAYRSGKELNAAQDFKAILADLLLPDPTGRYVFTRGKRLPDGMTASGWLRMGEREIIDLFRTAPDQIKNLPHIGPMVNRIGMIAQEMSRSMRGPAMARQRYPWLFEEARDVLESLVDDVVESAPLHETKHFHDWLVEQYQGSALTRPRRPLRPSDINLDNPRWADVDRAFSELNAAGAHYSALGEQADRLKGVLALAEFRTGGKAQKLTWDDLLNGSETQAVRRVIEFFKDPDSPMSLSGFRDIARQARFMNPRDTLSVEQIVKDARRLHASAIRLGQDISEWQRTANDLIRELGGSEQVVVNAAAGFSNSQRIRQFAKEYGFNYEAALSVKPDTLPTYKLWRDMSSVEIASLISKHSHKPAWQAPRVTVDMPVVEGGPREIPGPKWASIGGMNDAIQRAFATFASDHRNALSPAEVIQRLTPAHIVAEDPISQALMALGLPRDELAKRLGASLSEARRLRQNLSDEITAAKLVGDVEAGKKAPRSLSAKKLTQEAASVRRAAELVSDVIESHALATGQQLVEPGQAGADLTKPVLAGARIRRGVVEMPEWFGKALADWIDEQTKLRIAELGPGKVTQITAEHTRRFAERYIGPALDYVVFGVTPGETLDRLATQLGPERAARFVQPRHQRPIFDTFDPMTAVLDTVDWTRQGRVFDMAMRQFYEPDEVWGDQVRYRMSPLAWGELTKMSKGIKMGDYTSYVAHTVWRNVAEEAKQGGRNLSEIYDHIMAGMDEIVNGAPSAQMLYGAMFDNSEEMAMWLRWARQRRSDGRTNWDRTKNYWGDLTPHMSLSRMPKPIFDQVFGTARLGRSRHGKTPVADDIKRLDDFVHDRLDLKDLTPDERLEAEFWRDVLRTNWETKIKLELQQSADADFFKLVHLDDLDALVFPDEALDPFDAQLFAERLGTKAAEIEHQRLGYDPSQVAFMLKATYFIKRTLGWVWLRAAPRYIINNIGGNINSILLSGLRSDTAPFSFRVNKRVERSINSKHGSALGHRMMTHGIASTEFGDAWLRMKPGATAEQRSKDLATTRKTLLDGANSRTGGGPIRTLGRPVVGGFRAFDRLSARITDHLELDARRRVWTGEFDHRYKQAWGEHLNGITSLGPELREQLAGQLELSDVNRILRENGVDETTRFLVFRGHNDAISRANLSAYTRTRDALRDYQMRNRYDTFMDRIFPYHFWTTKNFLFVTRTMLDRPVLAYNAMKVYDQWSEQWDDMPGSMREKLHPFTVPEQVPLLGGRTIAIRPHNLTNPAFFHLVSIVDELRDAWTANEDTTMVERLFRTGVGGGMAGWQESGYSPGPHLDLVAAVANSEPLDAELRDIDPKVAEYWQGVMNSAVLPFLRPAGFRGQLLPLGGLESGLLWAAGDETIVPRTRYTKDQTVRQLYANLTKKVHNTPWNQAEVIALGKVHMLAMLLNGELGPIETEENRFGETTYHIPDETWDVIAELSLLIANGDVNGLEQHEYGKKLMDRFYAEQGAKRTVNYFTALSFAEITKESMLAHQAMQTWAALRAEDDFIPAYGNNIVNDKKAALVTDLNAQIQAAQDEREKHMRVNDWSPESRAEALDTYNATLSKIYEDADKAGLWVPALEGRSPNRANEFAFGAWNPATQRWEGAHAPWLKIIWTAFDDPAAIEEQIHRDKVYQERNQQAVSFLQSARERRARRGVTGEFYNRLEDNEDELQVELKRIGNLPVSDNVKLKLEHTATQRFRRRRSQIYNEAEAKGISLAGDDTRPPYQTSRWYDAAAATNGDVRLLYEQAGLSVPKDRELLTFDQMLSLASRRDRMEAHTHWAMDQVIEALGLDPYIPGTKHPNPKFMTDRRFDEGVWKRYLQAHADEILTQYENFVRDQRIGPPGVTHDPEQRRPQLLAQEITFKDFMSYITEEVAPKQTAYEIAYNAAVDEVRKLKGDEREAAKAKYTEVFGPNFMRWEKTGGSLAVDMDEVASTITDLYAGLRPEARRVFEIEHGSVLTGDGELKVVDPDKLTAQQAQEIARQYGIDIPTYQKQYQLTAGRQAIEDLWYRELSTDQKQQWIESLSSDEYAGFITTQTGQDPETGETYSYKTINVEALSAEQVAEIRNMFDIPLPADPINELVDLNDARRNLQTHTHRYAQLLERAAFDKETEALTEQFWSGELFLDSPEEQERWQAWHRMIEEHRDLYDAAQELREATGASWGDLVEKLEKKSPQAGQDMSLQEFAELYVTLIDEYDMPTLWNKRKDWMKTEFGQSLMARDPDTFARFFNDDLDDAATGSGSGESESGGSGGRGGSGGGRRSGGGRSFGGRSSGGSSSRSITQFDGDVRGIFRLDEGMVNGTVGDAGERFEIASQIAELLDKRLQVLQFLPRDVRSMFAQLYIRAIEKILGDTPTLEAWMEVLRRFRGGGGQTRTGASLGLQEQPEFAGTPQEEELLV